MLTFTNVTSLRQMAMLKSKVVTQTKLAESVTNETLIPLKYIIQFGKALLLKVNKGDIAKKISLILSIAKVLDAKM